MLTLLLLVAAQPAPEPAPAPTITVTGHRPEDSKRALNDCLARKCPPLEDIGASLRHAEDAFVAGDYREARFTLKASIGRNGQYARAYPREVAGLYRAGSRIALHLGEGQEFRSYAYAVPRALRAALPADSREVLMADLEAGLIAARLGDGVSAETELRQIAQRADAAGQPISPASPACASRP